ncbi:MAG: hypothetical protein QOJ09_1712 [Actinomycetota bacterium]|jgi:hypothetical protein|nr:hypothetical protein [Actinomycetota bacterium]
MVLLGVFLIPITVSSLRGLTHVLTCDADVATPFTISIPRAGPPSITSSATITREQAAGQCGGLFLNMRVGSEAPGKLKVTLPIHNKSKFDWKGTVELKLGKTAVPVDIGNIKAGRTAMDTIDVKVAPGTTEVNGSLLIGP